jgi:hypothetical protein
MGKWLEMVNALQEDTSIDPDYFIARACNGLPVSVAWAKRVVLDDFDIQVIKDGEFPMECLIAHIKLKIKEHKIVEMRW